MLQLDYLKLLDGEDFIINDRLKIKHPSLREIKDYGERKYIALVSLFCTKPYDMMVQLDDIGIDYVTLDDYDMFIMLYRSYEDYNTELKWLWGDLNFKLGINKQSNEPVLYDLENDVIIDRLVYQQISDFIRTINMIPNKIEFNAANKRLRKTLIKEKRKEMNKKKDKEFKSNLANQVSSMVWNEYSPYDHNTIWGLKMYPFMEGLMRISKRDKSKNTLFGIYSGTVDGSKINEDILDWTSNIQLN